MRNDNKAENQHYVPKMLLRNFCFNDKKQIYVYDKWERRSFTTNIDNIACERNFNVVGKETDRMNAEPFFTFVENDAKIVIDKLVKNRQFSVLDPKDRMVLSFFIASQFMRTRQTREAIKAMHNNLAEHIKKMGYDPTKVEGFKLLNEEELKALSIQMLEAVPKFAQFVTFKDWVLLQTKNDNPFYISDNPIGFHNENDFGAYGNIGFAVKGIEIYCPLSPEVSFGMFCPSVLADGFKEMDNFEATMNKQKVLSAIGATEKISNVAKASIEAINSILKNNPTMSASIEKLRRIDIGEAIEQTVENMEFANYVQVRFAHRYIYSFKNDFSLVEKILNDNPDWNRGLMPKFN